MVDHLFLLCTNFDVCAKNYNGQAIPNLCFKRSFTPISMWYITIISHCLCNYLSKYMIVIETNC